MAQTFLSRIDTNYSVPAGRFNGVDPNWTGYQSPACIYNQSGSGKILRVRKINFQSGQQNDFINESTFSGLSIVSITAHTFKDPIQSSVFKVDSNSSTFPSQVEIYKDTYIVTESQTMLKAASSLVYQPTANAYTLYQRNFLNKWNDATTSELQKITLRNGEGIALKTRADWRQVGNTYNVEIVFRVSDTGSTYILNELVSERHPYPLSILNNGYTAGNIEIISINTTVSTAIYDSVASNILTVNDEFILIRNAQVDTVGREVTPFSFDSTNSLSSKVKCYDSATVTPLGNLTSSMGRISTVGNSIMRTQMRSILITSPTNQKHTLYKANSIESDIVLKEGMGIAYIPQTFGSFLLGFVEFEFTQENIDANSVYPAVGDVDLSVTYGPTGADYTGTLEQPAITDVLSGVQYGAGGTEFTGTATGGGGGETSHVF